MNTQSTTRCQNRAGQILSLQHIPERVFDVARFDGDRLSLIPGRIVLQPNHVHKSQIEYLSYISVDPNRPTLLNVEKDTPSTNQRVAKSCNMGQVAEVG